MKKIIPTLLLVVSILIVYAQDPCSNITPISCGTNYTFSSNGSGVWKISGCGDGKEQIYSYTPTVSGVYNINITFSNNDVCYFYRSDGLCSNTGWTFLTTANYTGSIGTINMVAGTTYYILFDAYNSTSTSQQFNIECPCSGTPNTPTLSADRTTVTCIYRSATIKANGVSSVVGITYQWQISLDGGSTWANMVGKTGTSIKVSPKNDTHYRIITTCSVSGNTSTSAPILIRSDFYPVVNDEPCDAIQLNVGNTCMFSSYDNICATASEDLQPGIPDPGCGNYQGIDVWFKVTVPASGRLIVDLDDIELKNCGMAWYTGPSCNELTTLIECDDNDSRNGDMPMICRTGSICTVPGDCQKNTTLTPGSTVWIRVWDEGNNYIGNFDICAYDPGEDSIHSVCSNATVITSLPYFYQGTTCCSGNDYGSTVGCKSSYQNGEDYLFSYTPTSNITVDVLVSSTGSSTGVFITDKCPNESGVTCKGMNTDSKGYPQLCGVSLTAGTTYYIMVDTYADPNCSPFTITVRENIANTCLLNYSISTISLDWTSTIGGTEIILPTDDRFSSYIPIGFDFCFDGIQYSRLLVSSNAYLIFDAIGCVKNLPKQPDGSMINATPAGKSSWTISSTDLPSTTLGPRNAIMFPWTDTRPSHGGKITSNLIGTAPNRIFIISYENVPYYASGGTCSGGKKLTAQVKLFETTNNIEIHIVQRDICDSWNGGRGILGLHNYSGLLAKIPTGYNGTNSWTASNNAWRFTCNCPNCVVVPVLPIELESFDYECMNDLITFNWVSLTETNNEYFILEESEDGINYKPIAKIDGAGNSNTKREYTYDHFRNSSQYYRLKQVDFDGKSETFNPIFVDCDNSKSKIELYPNPATKEKGVQINGKYDDIIIQDMLGVRYFPTIKDNLITGLETGVYIVTIDKKYRIKLVISEQ